MQSCRVDNQDIMYITCRNFILLQYASNMIRTYSGRSAARRFDMANRVLLCVNFIGLICIDVQVH